MSGDDQLRQLQAELEAAAGTLPLTTVAADIVPGEGSSTAEVLLIGEAPGQQETVERRPFVGRSGKLLRQTLVDVGLQPELLYISNIVKARPPENRDPSPKEILAYKPYLDREIALLNPKLIVTLGRLSMAKFLKDVKITQVHGQLHTVNWEGKQVFVLPMFHPAAALRATRVKEAFIADFGKIQKILTWIIDQSQPQEFQEKVLEANL